MRWLGFLTTEESPPMAKSVKFGKSPKTRKRADTSFDFGFNTLSKKKQGAYRKKVGGKGGGS
jgi:hypothetical protein